MRLSHLVVVAVVLAGCPAPRGTSDNIRVVKQPVVTPPKPQVPPGLVPAQPALRLPKNFVATGYRARLDVDPAKAGFTGAIAITGTVAERSSVIWLHGHHLKVSRAVATQGDPFDERVTTAPRLTVEVKGEELLRLEADRPLEPGQWTLMLEYTGEYDLLSTAGAFKQVVAGQPYVYTQFESTYARRAFPCIDEPDSKVPWQLTFDVPRALIAVSNTSIAKETALGTERKRVEFGTTRPLPSYLVAFGVGPFDFVDAGVTHANQPIRIVTLKGRAADAAWAAKTTGRIVEILEDYFGTPYPYEKLDMLAIPLTVGFGAMENPGLITFTETLILQDHPSRQRQYAWVLVAGHELAHQWFGDLVTTAWWDDIWLNEGFAQWMESKVTARFEPSWHDEGSIVDLRDSALGDDALVTARQIRQPIETADDILTAVDGITYNKGASVLAMFETFVGPETFQRGIRAYLDEHKWGTATSSDFAAAISKAAGKDVTAAFATFLDQPGAPELALTCTAGKLTLAQHRYIPPGAAAPTAGKPWLLPVCVSYEKAGRRANACTVVEGATTTLALDPRTCPRWIAANTDGHGYYRVAYTAAQLTALRDEGWTQLSSTERQDIFFNTEEGATLGKLPLQLALSFVPRMLVDNTRFSLGSAISLPVGLDWLVPDELRGKYEAWLRATFGLAQAKTGLTPKDGEELDAESTRQQLIAAVGWYGREPKLVEDALELAKGWRDLPTSIRPQMLALAVDAKQDEFDRFVKVAHGEPDRQRRGEIFNALGAVRDPKRFAQALDLIADTSLDIRETLWLLFRGSTPAQHALAQQFYLAHEADLMKRMPIDTAAFPMAYLSAVFTGTCQADKRDEMAALATQHFAKLPGGERVVKQNLEGMDQCIARRKLLESEVRGWLTGVKIPKPAVAPAPAAKPAAHKKR